MRVSASQLKTFACPRKWALERHWGLMLPFGEALASGNIFHRAAEIWLRANDRGRDEAGNIVDPFKGDWWIWSEKGLFYAMDEAEQELLKELFSMAISQGVLKRLPGRKIEEWISMPILDNVDFIGKCDMLVEGLGEIHDHKTVKKRRYALSAEALKKDLQMMAYAKFLRLKRPDLTRILLRHNYFVKDYNKPETFVRETFVSTEEIDLFWNETIKPLAAKMYALKTDLDEKRINNYSEVEASGSLCNAYGGCPFQHLCAGTETFDACKARLERMGKSILKKMEAKKMGIFQRQNGDQRKDVKEPKPTVQEAASAAGQTPEWAQETCKACGGTGYNSKGKPCAICKRIFSIKNKKSAAAKAEAPAAALDTETTETPAAEVPQQQQPQGEEKPKKRGRGRPPKGEEKRTLGRKVDKVNVVLYLNCVPTTGRAATPLEDVINDLLANMPETDREKLEEMDFFHYRDMLGQILIQERASLPKHIFANTQTPLQQALVSYLRRVAKVVVEALK